MMSLAEIITQSPNLSDADVLAEYLAQPPERIQTPIQTVRSYLADEFLTVPIRKVIADPNTPESVRDGLTAFLDGLENAQTFNGLNDKVYGLTKLLVPTLVKHIPILSAVQASAILAFIERAPIATLDDVARERRRIRADALLIALATFESGKRAEIAEYDVNGGTVPEVPSL